MPRRPSEPDLSAAQARALDAAWDRAGDAIRRLPPSRRRAPPERTPPPAGQRQSVGYSSDMNPTNYETLLPDPQTWLAHLRHVWDNPPDAAHLAAKGAGGAYPEGHHGTCTVGAVALRDLLARGGVRSKAEAGSVPGFYWHAWLRTPDGTILDPTEFQVRGMPGTIGVYPPDHPRHGDYWPEKHTGSELFTPELWDQVSQFQE